MAFQKIKSVRIPFSFLLLGLLAACAGNALYLKKGYAPPKILAVLPMNNFTTDLDGPQAVRYWFDQRVTEKKGYATVPLEEVDRALKKIGITDGGQLAAVKPQDLGAKLKADALVYGDLLEFNYQTTGFLNVRKVKAHFRMVDTGTMERLWEAEGSGANSNATMSGSEALKAGLKSLGTQMAEKAMGSPLKYEIWDAVWNAIEFLPRAQ